MRHSVRRLAAVMVVAAGAGGVSITAATPASAQVYAWGIFGLLEGNHPTMIYPPYGYGYGYGYSGYPYSGYGYPGGIICRAGIDCPSPPGYAGPVADTAPVTPAPTVHRRRHRPKHRY